MLYLIVGFLLGAATLLFALQNTEVVSLGFLGWQFESSLALVIIIATAIGVLVGILAALPAIIDRSFTIMSLKRQNRQLAEHADKLQEHTQVVAENLAASATVPPATIDLRS